MRPVVCFTLVFLSLAAVGLAQTPPEPPEIDFETARFSRIAHALAIEEAIVVDGRLDESAWGHAVPVTGFLQSGRSRNPGGPATERTEVRFLYDAGNLYISAICFETDINSLVINGLTRDFPTNLGDEFGMILDTLDDDRSGFFFGTNPAGAKADSQLANESQYNDDWDAVWDVQVRVEEDRWVAEFVIPFRTLRFSNSPSQEWGLNMFRKIRRRNEESYWSPVPRRYGLSRISLAGTLAGLEDIRQGRNLKVKPYGKAGFAQQRSAGELETDSDFNGGFDAKYGLTQSLTLDVTYRTDFSQAEVDQEQVNLTRFNLFFPEKREFFLENSGVFAFGSRRAATFGRGGGENLIPFFSRRIGLSSGGTPIPIVGGARVSGTIGRYEVGILSMKTESAAGTPSNDLVVGRIKRNVLGNSFVGAIVTSRDSSVEGDYNRVYGVDAVFQLYNNLDISGYLLESSTPGKSGNDRAGKLAIAWREDDWNLGGAYEKVQEDFNPELGFIRRDDNSHYSGNFAYEPRLESNERIRNLSFRTGYDFWEGVTGDIETRRYDVTAGVVFENGASIKFTTAESFERLNEEFSRYSIRVGDYAFRDYALSYTSDRSRKVGGTIRYDWGDFWNGTRRSIGGDVTFKPTYHWQIDATFSRDDIEVPTGDFITTLVGLKVLYSRSSRSFLNTFLQYNAERRQFSTNIRFNLIHHPLSDIFIVFNERRDTVTGEVVDRGLVFKVTNLFTF